VQFLLNAMNANTATIGQAYAEGVIQSYNATVRPVRQIGVDEAPPPGPSRRGLVRLTPTFLNPIHHFATIVRASMLKGSGVADLWPNALALLVFTLVLVSLSIWRSANSSASDCAVQK